MLIYNEDKIFITDFNNYYIINLLFNIKINDVYISKDMWLYHLKNGINNITEIIFKTSDIYYFKNCQLHSLSYPIKIYDDQFKYKIYYYIDGIKYNTEESYNIGIKNYYRKQKLKHIIC